MKKNENSNMKVLTWMAFGGVLAINVPIFYHLYTYRWEAVDYTHAYFILPVSLWLVFKQRKLLASLIVRELGWKSYWLPILVVGLGVFIFGWRLDYASVMAISMIPVVYGLIGYLFGNKVVKKCNFPILYLLLMVPPPLGILDSITLPMRHWISVLTEMIIKACGYPIVRDGLLLSIDGHEIYMGAPCSGFRSLITMIALGLVYVYINKGSFKKKAILLGSVVPFALFGNLARVVSMCIVTFYFGEGVGHTYHDYSGYLIFLVLIAGLVGTEVLLNKVIKE